MVAPIVIAAAVGAVATIASGISASNSSSKNASSQAAAAAANAQYTLGAANQTADLQMYAAAANAMTSSQITQVNQQTTSLLADYNSAAVLGTAAYNNSLLENDKDSIYTQYELENWQYERDSNLAISSMVAGMTASGTTVGYGSNKDAVIDARALQAMNMSVLKYNADIAAANIANRQAKSQYEAQALAQKYQYEAQLNNWAVGEQSRYQVTNTMMNGMFASEITRNNGRAEAYSILSGGAASSAYYTSLAGQQMVASTLSAGSTAVNAWAQSQPTQPELTEGA